ncbi:MAG: class I SAM-dependent methyltransferase [Candidatus Aminicenantes bacterium]|nr:class I SAM-dependent methyltransferase [Candidatus Aminicenantes bacterium]
MTKGFRSGAAAFVLAVLLSLAGLSFSQTSQNDAERFDRIARTVFKPIYPALARQIKEDYGITKGVCVDAGAGPGYLSIELAKITDLVVWAVDIDPAAVRIAERNIKEAGLAGRVKPIQGDVHKMPFDAASVDLVVSRGSIFFWKDKVQGLREVWRILKPGGAALLGGGAGRLVPQDVRLTIQEAMDKLNLGPPPELQMNPDQATALLRAAGIREFEITYDTTCLCGVWLEFRKPALDR